MQNFDEQMKGLYELYGVSNDNQLSKKLGYTNNSAIAQWRKIKKIPAKYLLKLSIERSHTNKAKETIDRWLFECGFSTYKELARFLGVAPNTLDIWKQRGAIPEKNILKYNVLKGNSAVAIGEHNIAVNGENNTINGIPRYSKKVDEFLALYEKYGNEDLDYLLDEIIEKLKRIRDISKTM
ncbi:MAG: helix-turn-helix domain-containing protein [Wolinella sp.]